MDETSLRIDDDFAADPALQVLEAELSGMTREAIADDCWEEPCSDPPRALRPPLGIFAASVFGVLSAVLYTMANIALRNCVDVDPFLVSAVKAFPTVLVLGPFLGWMLLRGETIATHTTMVPRFILAAFVGQVVGNAAFQIALGVIGLAVSVPITLGVLIVGGAILGRVILHEPVRLRTIIAMVTLISAVIILSLPSGAQSPSSATSVLPFWAGAVFAAASGAAYALFGVVMRQALTDGLSAPATMCISGVVGSIALWSITFLRIGVAPLESVPIDHWGMMLAAGAFNFSAFVSLTAALKTLPVIAVNLINASQVAMAAIAGVVLFAEPITATLTVGILLTFAGLSILANRKNRSERRSEV